MPRDEIAALLAALADTPERIRAAAADRTEAQHCLQLESLLA